MIIYSKLPRSMNFTVGADTVTIYGNQVETRCPLPGHGKTEVADARWEAIAERYKKHPALMSGHIFVAKNQKEAADRAEEMKDEKTGLEQLDPDSVPGIQRNDDPEVKSVPTQQARK